jgi:hypothetical protein
MKKRQFLSAAAVAGLALPLAGHAQPGGKPGNKVASGPGLLTVSGAIGPGNRGAIDPALDQLMVKQKVRFDKAHVFDFAALTVLPAITIKPTLEYDAKPHTLKGPLLADVVKAAGAPGADSTRLMMRAVDGYVAPLTLGDARKYRYIVATHLDGVPMSLGGLGPLWAVYDADRFPDMMAKPLGERFGACPWGFYHLEIVAA